MLLEKAGCDFAGPTRRHTRKEERRLTPDSISDRILSLRLFERRRPMRRRVGKGSLPPHRVAVRVVIDEAPPALAMERLPMAFRLGEPVRDGEERRRMRHEAYVARLDDDVLGEVAPRLEAAAPGYNAVGRTPDRRRRHGRRCAQASVKIVRIDAMPAGELVQAPRIRLARMAGERRTKRDDEPHQFGRKLCELARIEPAKTSSR